MAIDLRRATAAAPTSVPAESGAFDRFSCFASACGMDCLLPEIRDLLSLMQEINCKQDEYDEAAKKMAVHLPKEASTLFRREEVDKTIADANVLVKAAEQVDQMDAELRIVFCEAQEKCDKAKEGKSRLCLVNKEVTESLLQTLISDVPVSGHCVEQAINKCDRLSNLMGKKSILATKTASELKNMVRRLDEPAVQQQLAGK